MFKSISAKSETFETLQDKIESNAKLNLFFQDVEIWKIVSDGASYKTETTKAISELCANLLEGV